LRLLNHGFKPAEIAAQLRWPTSLETNWATRGYYGTLSHNAKAISQRYIGWYDGNPATLDPLPPVPRAKKQLEYMGGAEAVLAKARADYEAGAYRWVADVTNVVVFAEPANAEARALCAAACEQLGYQAESATWRNAYLQAAQELRRGVPKIGRALVSADVVTALTVPQMFDYLAVRIDPAKAEGQRFVIDWDLPDVGERIALTLDNCALTYVDDHEARDAHVTVTIAKPALAALLLGKTSLSQAVIAGHAHMLGDGSCLDRLLAMVDTFDPAFAVVEPHIRAPT
jgi:alkyl sulfatase BDS1-like metallo-beta-lactamase superfamily hydrolase